MKRNLIAALLLGCTSLSAVAADHDFNSAVSTIEHNYHLHRQHLPLIGLASFCAHVATGGAVKGIKVAAFDRQARLPVSADLPLLLKGTLGSSWSLIVASISRDAAPSAAKGTAQPRRVTEQDAIFARPHGERMTLMVATYDEEGLSLFRVDLNAEQFVKWMHDPLHHAHHAETS